MQSSREEQREIRRPSSTNNAKKQRKTIEWERRDFFKKIGDIKRVFHGRMGKIKDRNRKDLKEAEEIRKRWQEYTELYKKCLYGPDNCNGGVTHLEPDILECEVKWALGSIAMNRIAEGDGIPAELFQILSDDVVQMLHSIY